MLSSSESGQRLKEQKAVESVSGHDLTDSTVSVEDVTSKVADTHSHHFINWTDITLESLFDSEAQEKERLQDSTRAAHE